MLFLIIINDFFFSFKTQGTRVGTVVASKKDLE